MNILILLVTQNLIGSIVFGEDFLNIIYNNLPWRHNTVEFVLRQQYQFASCKVRFF
jgi:hypothetical protein